MAAKQTKKKSQKKINFFLKKCVLFESTVSLPKYSLPPRFYAFLRIFYAFLRGFTLFLFPIFFVFCCFVWFVFVFVVPDSCR